MRIFFIVNMNLRAPLHFLARLHAAGIFSSDYQRRAPFPGHRRGRVLDEAREKLFA
jgi:hypothetical protein